MSNYEKLKDIPFNLQEDYIVENYRTSFDQNYMNQHSPFTKEKYGSFSISAAVRPPYWGYCPASESLYESCPYPNYAGVT